MTDTQDNHADGLAIATLAFSRLLGIELLHASKDRVTARLLVRDDLCTAFGSVHGGALMAFADTLGAIGATLNLPEGAGGTVTVESKTNFLSGANAGTEISAETTPVHIGRRTSVWQTRISRADGKPVAIVTQTQMVV